MDRELLRFNVLRNALYHTARRRSLERWNRVFNFVVVVLGAAAFGQVVTQIAINPAWIGLIVAVVGALQLVMDFGRQARDHQSLQRDYYFLLADIEQNLDDSPERCAEWVGRMLRITADEPPTLRSIDAKAYNDALDAIGKFETSERLVIPLTHRLFGWILPFEGHEYKKLREIRTEA